ncbi:MAG: translation initiation factor [Verrucomicrobiales bacterium]|jgi:translation initiation factor 1|nr:translation initiation factor [Verrucomicrobiales bacterium]
MSRKKGRKSRGQEEEPMESPFDELAELLGKENLPQGPEPVAKQEPRAFEPPPRRGKKNTTRGRIEVQRQTAHRGGKGVTVASGFKGIPLQEKKELAKKIQKMCGVGGTVKDGCIEIQGDNREAMVEVLTEAGFNPVVSGG